MGTPDQSGELYQERFRARILRNANRGEIIELLACRPGMNLRQLGRALGLTVTGIQFHVERMVKYGLVSTRDAEQGRETLCFLPEDVRLWDRRETRSLFGRSSTRELAFYLAEHPMSNALDTAEVLGVAVHTVRRNVRTLEAKGLVHRLIADHEVVYHAAPVLDEWVEDMKRLHQDRCRINCTQSSDPVGAND